MLSSRFPLTNVLSRFNVEVSALASFASTGKNSSGELRTPSRRLPHGYNPPTSFALYVKENIKPGVPTTQSFSDAAKSWKQMTDGMKLIYQEKAKQIADQRKAEFNRLSAIDQSRLEDEYTEAKKKKALRVHRKVVREFHEEHRRPKAPLNHYVLYTKDFFSRVPKTTSRAQTIEVLSKAAKTWSALPDSEKNKWRSLAAPAFEKYKAELKKWESKQQAGGLPLTPKAVKVRVPLSKHRKLKLSKKAKKSVSAKKTAKGSTKPRKH